MLAKRLRWWALSDKGTRLCWRITVTILSVTLIHSYIHSHMHSFHMTHLLKIHMLTLRMSVTYFKIAADILVCDERQTCPVFPNLFTLIGNHFNPIRLSDISRTLPWFDEGLPIVRRERTLVFDLVSTSLEQAKLSLIFVGCDRYDLIVWDKLSSWQCQLT